MNTVANHRFGDAVSVRGVAPGKTAFDTGMAFVGFAIPPGHHAHDFGALHLGLETATDAAVCAGGDDIVVRLAHLDQCLLGQGGRRASVDTGATRHTF